MDFYFDENFSHYMASAMNELEKGEEEHRVLHTLNEEGMGRGVKDEVLIPLLGQRRGILMTKDKKQTTRSAQFQMLNEHGVSAFYFSHPTLSHWDQMLSIMKQWREITKIARRKKIDQTPNFFTVFARGGIEDWGEEWREKNWPPITAGNGSAVENQSNV